MSQRLDNRVAFVTGAAQGMGRSHVVRLAQEGADIVAVDLESPDAGAAFARTIELVQATGRRILARQADVRDEARLTEIAREAHGLLGRIDIVVANAGVFPPPQAFMDLPSAAWSAAVDVNLTGTWNTVRATTPHIRAGKRGGVIILTSSPYGLKGCAGGAHYAASKHAVVGLMKSLALELGPEWIRVNSIHPTTVDTHMLRSVMPAAMSTEELAEALKGFNVLPVPWIEPVDVSNAIVFLASDEARYITGAALPIDAGGLLK
jgi:(+)-trans-carveol dehydrogenase